jgi:hypothetical protein
LQNFVSPIEVDTRFSTLAISFEYAIVVEQHFFCAQSWQRLEFPKVLGSFGAIDHALLTSARASEKVGCPLSYQPVWRTMPEPCAIRW